MTPTHLQILEVLDELSRCYPEMRFGQLVVNVSNWATQVPDASWDVEDEAFLEAARRHLQRRTNGQVSGTPAGAANLPAP